jgi:hypothetical protein
MESGTSNLSRIWIARGAAILLFLAGVIHLAIIPHHWEHAPAHGIFMGVIGVVEIIWAVAFWLKPTIRLAQVGVIISIVCITLWAITRILPAPFGHGPEEVDVSGIITKILEGITALLLISGIIQALPFRKNGYRALQIVISVLLLAVFLGLGVYEVARASEPLFPSLMASEIQEHNGEEHQHMPGTEAPGNDQMPEMLPTP